MKTVERDIDLGGIAVKVKITYRATSVLSVRIRRGVVCCSAPIRTSMRYIEGFLERKKDWINEQLAAAEKRGEEVFLMGEKYGIAFGVGKNDVTVDGTHNLIIVATSDGEREDSAVFFKKWYRKQAEKTLSEEFFATYEECRRSLGLNYVPKLTVNFSRGYWGKCFSKNREIKLSAYLLQCDYPLRNYVYLHEIAHLIVQDHSPRFHALLETVCPNERKLMRLLRRYKTEMWFDL